MQSSKTSRNCRSLRKPPTAHVQHKILCRLKCESVSTKLIAGPLLSELTWLQIVVNNYVNRNTWNTTWKLRQNNRTKVLEMITDYFSCSLATCLHLPCSFFLVVQNHLHMLAQALTRRICMAKWDIYRSKCPNIQ